MRKLQIFQPNLEGFLLDHVELNPTEAQIKSGDYDKAKMSIQGMDITIENPKGSTRSGVDKDGKKWSSTMKSHYGYFDGTHDRIGEDIDVFVGDNTSSTMIYVIDQIEPTTGKFDESKVMLGYNSHEEAKNGYLENYDKDWKGFGNITPVHIDKFKEWLYDGGRQLLPFHKYSSTPNPINEDFEKQEYNPKFDYDTAIIKQFNDMGFTNVKVTTSLANGLSQYVTLTVDVLNEGKTYAEMFVYDNKTTITIRISDHDSGLEKNCNGVSGNQMTLYKFKRLIDTGAIKGSN